MATLAHKVSPAQERRIIEALAAPSFEVSPETPTVTVRALITHGLAYHGQLRERVLDERGHLVRSHGVMLTDAGVAEARRLSGQDAITREDVARGAEDALQWLPRSARDAAAQAGPATVLAMEFRRAGAVWRQLAKQGGRVPVETQALKHYNRVQDLLRAARRFDQEDTAARVAAREAQEDAAPLVGEYYATVRDGERAGLLLGPYETREEAEANMPRARSYVQENDSRGHFYAFGTARIRWDGRPVKPGKLNDRIGLRAEEAPERQSA